MSNIEQSIREKLLSLKDDKNQIFVSKLIPNISSDKILWIKTPVLRNIAKELSKNKDSFDFLNSLPHYYLEENTLHWFLIESLKDFHTALHLTEKFLPFIDNRATCDSFSPKIFKKHPNEIYEKIKLWIKSDDTYTTRFAIWLLLSNYLDKEFKEEMLVLVSEIHSDEYYIQMMQAWYFATALAKQEKVTLKLIKKKELPAFLQNKSIQKARESRRISIILKEELNAYKI